MIKPVIKWSGSKRTQAATILSFFPKNFGIYYEPFVGGGSMLYALRPKRSICGDICKPLIDLWVEIRDNPKSLAVGYRVRWTRLQEEGYTVYYDIRDNFNKDKSPYDLMFLSRTCVNGLIRFNDKGEFNNSLHYSRKGINPDTLETIIDDWSRTIQNTTFLAEDYINTTSSATIYPSGACVSTKTYLPIGILSITCGKALSFSSTSFTSVPSFSVVTTILPSTTL